MIGWHSYLQQFCPPISCSDSGTHVVFGYVRGCRLCIRPYYIQFLGFCSFTSWHLLDIFIIIIIIILHSFPHGSHDKIGLKNWNWTPTWEDWDGWDGCLQGYLLPPQPPTALPPRIQHRAPTEEDFIQYISPLHKTGLEDPLIWNVSQTTRTLCPKESLVDGPSWHHWLTASDFNLGIESWFPKLIGIPGAILATATIVVSLAT